MTPQEFIAMLQQYDVMGALIIIICAFIAGHIVKQVIRLVAKRLAGHTKTSLDDEMLHATETPILWGITIAGIFVASFSINVLKPHGTIILKIATVVGILWGAWLVMRILAALLNWYSAELAHKTKTDLDDKYMHIFKRVFNIIIFIIVGLIILQQLGVSVTPLLASLGIAGLAVGLALQDTLANFFAGFYLISERAIKIGDYVEVEGGTVKGHVEDINWRSTRVRSLANNMIIIPNSKFSQSTVTNYQAPTPDLSLLVPVGVAYDSDLDKVEEVTLEVAKKAMQEVEGGMKDAEPLIRYNGLGDFAITFNVILRANDPVNQYFLRHEFIKRLMKRYRKEKIEVPFPIRTVYMHNAHK
jgi:small-conductance mechanosensitive channel